ncbi:MAG TPA: YbaB/EbfC family nucleoid-associated protein [Candidatus Krumholzibacteria bacterium]|nr:YbaB/EbfC family nucleoid-associated protein [Candidatus Krumholzibacteria bacterium]HRX50097.1 YbaB/EbfC family nucleoid-associated protein [Candidatus Krumholzibacteria bacterium]
MDIRALMKQAQQMQKKMAAVQEELAAKEITAEVAGGQVVVTMNGKHQVTGLVIKPEVVDPDDVEFLADMVQSAVNEAARKVDEMVESEMGSVTGGMNIPGMPGF